jgi:hypothetical protein
VRPVHVYPQFRPYRLPWILFGSSPRRARQFNVIETSHFFVSNLAGCGISWTDIGGGLEPAGSRPPNGISTFLVGLEGL